MAESVLLAIAGSVLKVLASPAMDELKLLWGQKEQLERLEGTLTTIRDALYDADRKQASDARVQGWLARLKVVLYEADDLFDLISANSLRDKARRGNQLGKMVGLFLMKPRNFAFSVKIAHKVKSIRERLDFIASDIQGFGFLPIQTEQDEPLGQKSHSYVPSVDVIGREEERKDLVKMLLGERSRQQRGVSVVAVIGFGGLGKTTLAQLVYNDERVQRSFDLRIWVCVNYFTPLKQVLVALIKSAKMGDPKDPDLDELQELFREKIRGKRFLLALDDVWDEDPQNWYKLKILLDLGANGSMILTTAPSERVAQSMCVTNCCRLKGLSDQSAWLLFKKIAFGEDEGQFDQEDFEQIGGQILEKCANVPLAVVTIAGLLRNKEKKMWLPLVNDELSRVVPDEHNKILQILKISYNRLPYAVKSCFAYCSLFPKQHRFEKVLLVRLWIAQGFVEPSNANQSLEDIAEGYFLCLVERCFFQDMKRDSNGVCSWGMHDLLHDLVVEVSRSESVILSEHTSLVNQVCSFSHSKSLRTFLCVDEDCYLGKNVLNNTISRCKALRVLRVPCCGIRKIPSSIGELIHLRFVDLSHSPIKKLPSSVCNIPHLQTLILKGCNRLRELPKDIGKLLSLRHLVLEGTRKLLQMPPGLAVLTSLVTLDRLVVHPHIGGLRYLELLDNLSGSLKIVLPTTGWKNWRMDAERSFLSRKNKLLTLAIQRKRTNDDVADLLDQDDVTVMDALQPHSNLEYLSIQNFRGKEMPSWLVGLHNLVSLTLESCERCTELAPLSRHKFLKELCIRDLPSVSVIENNMLYDPNLFFRSLETLLISRMPNLTSWWSQAPPVSPSFPRVTRIQIDRCPKLTASMPLFPLTLDSLKLKEVREELVWHSVRSEVTGHGSHGNSELKDLKFSGISGLSCISEAHIRHLSALQKLIIDDVAQLTSVSCVGLSYLTSLEVLKIEGCSNIKWIEGGDKKPVVPWKYLSRLRKLVLPNMTRSLFKGLKYLTCLEDLRLQNDGLVGHLRQSVTDSEEKEEETPWKSLEKLHNLTLKFGKTCEHFSKGVHHLTSLRRLAIGGCEELHLSWKALLSLNNLSFLRFSNIMKVISVDAAVEQMSISALQRLTVESAATEFVHDIPWKSFPTLDSLRLTRISTMEALPEGIQHLVALDTLDMEYCESLLSLPYWMSSLTSLRDLTIRGGCDALRKRCKKRTGQDWPHIQHIPRITFNSKLWFLSSSEDLKCV